ncbi:MAG: carboxypeptidase regulatory-like domain-containing protein [Gemmatimonadota bacterium]
MISSPVASAWPFRLLIGSCMTLALYASAAGTTGELAAQMATDAPKGVIRGTVASRFQDGTRPLGFVMVRASSDTLVRTAPADSAGRYRIEQLPPGRIVLRAFHPGHAPVELVVTVPAGGTVDVNLELLAMPIRLSAVDVQGTRGAAPIPEPTDARAPASTRTLAEVEMESLDLAPGVGQEGLLDAVRTMPGNDPADASDILFMRGSTTDLKLVLLDGVPVYTPFHVAGLMRSFEPAVLGSANLHVGGAPARYDGGLTHILELRTRKARRDRLRASGAVDLMTASAAVETPLGKRAGLLASARSLHDLGRAALGGAGPYGYRDLLVALDAEPATGHEIGVTGFLNSEAVRLDYTQTPDDARWSNVAGTFAYGRDLGSVRVDASLGASGYTATLPLQPSFQPGEPPPPTILATAGTERVRMVAEVSWGGADTPMRAGVSHERIAAAFKAAAVGDDRTNENRGRAESSGMFFEGTRPLGPALTLRGGVRADYFPGIGVRAAPRAAFLWEIGPEAVVTVAAGRYHQPARTVDPAVEHTLADVAKSGLEADEILPVATADHVILSLDQRMGNSVTLGLDGFFKRFEGLYGPRSETVRSSGVDLRILSAGDRASGWLGYGLSWFWSGLDLSGRPVDFSGRHLLTAGLAGRLAGPVSGEARISYGAGLPYTTVPIPSSIQDQEAAPTVSSGALRPQRAASGSEPLVSGLEQEFLRIDLELHARFKPDWGGRPWTIRPYVRVLNALDRRDAMFYTFQPWRDEALTPLAERALLPLLGVAFSFDP